MVVSDNGASAEGGPHGSVNENLFFNNVPETLEDNLKAIDELGGPKYFNHYPWGWAWAGNTPFRRWKRETYRGGVTDPFIVHWPKGIKAKGEIRKQYAHVIDMVPTVLDALGIEAPAQIRGVTQSPIQGVSFAHAFDDAKAETRHHTQYFEMMGHRAIYHDGWRAVCPVPGPSFNEAGMGFGEMVITEEKLRELDAKGWELYHVDEDFSETKNLAAEHRDKLIEMIAIWYVEAGKYDVLPIDSRGTARLVEERPQLAPPRNLLRLLPAHVGGLEQDRGAHAQPPAQHHRDGGDRERRRGRAGRAGRLDGRLLALRQGSQAALRLQLPRRAAVPRRDRHDGRRRAATSCASSSSRPASPTSRTARARRRTRSSTSTASWPARATCRSPSRSTSASPRA